MLKHSQYFAGNLYRPEEISPMKDGSNKINYDGQVMREWSRNRYNLSENLTQQKFQDIKKKYGSKEKNLADSYQSNALKEITLRNSNFNSVNSIKNTLLEYSTQRKTNRYPCTSAFSNSPKQYLPRRESSIYKQEIREKSSRISGEAHNFPRFRQKDMELDTSHIAKSIDGSQSGRERQERVESIAKINMKIYKILNSLNENNERKPAEISRFEVNKIEVNQPTQKLQNTGQQERITKVRFCIQKQRQNEQQKQQHRQKQKQRSESFSKPPYIPAKMSRKAQNILQDNNIRRYSVNSNIENRQIKSSLTAQKSRRQDSLFKDRDIDAQIKRIQQRIKKTQEQKKKLNIGYQQWKQPQLPKRVSSHSKISQKSSLLLERKNRLYNNMNKFNKQSTQENEQKLSAFKAKGKQQEIEDYRDRDNYLVKNAKSPLVTSRTRKEKENNYIKASYIYNEQIPKIETKKLIDSLKKQVTYDQCLRNAKVLLAQIPSNTNKWCTVKNILENKGFSLTQQEIKKQFETTPQEHNPFFSVRQSNQSIQQLVSKYIDSSIYWKQHLKGKFNLELLKKEYFTEDKIDLEKKSSLNVEDLVRFLNIETGNFYRNRDVILLFRRITPNQTTTFKEFMEVLTFI